MGTLDPQAMRARTFNLPKDFRGELMKLNNKKNALAKQTTNNADDEIENDVYFNKRTKTPVLSKNEQ